MIKIWLYITSFIKYFIIMSIIGGILMYFFSTIGVVIYGILLLGSFSAAYTDMKERYIKHEGKKQNKLIKQKGFESKHEFEGFDEALLITRREMNF